MSTWSDWVKTYEQIRAYFKHLTDEQFDKQWQKNDAIIFHERHTPSG